MKTTATRDEAQTLKKIRIIAASAYADGWIGTNYVLRPWDRELFGDSTFGRDELEQAIRAEMDRLAAIEDVGLALLGS